MRSPSDRPIRRVALLLESQVSPRRRMLTGVARYMHEHDPWAIYLKPTGVEKSMVKWLREWQGDGIIAAVSETELETVADLGIPVVDIVGFLKSDKVPLVHTNGDIYVHFRNANVLAVGDVASPLRDPALDYVTGAWIGGRVDAMDVLLTIANDGTRIVPAYGPVLSKAEFKAERDLMEEVRKRLFDQVREGDGPKDMLERGALKGLARTWKDPDKFLYDAAKGLWAHHDKLGPNVV